MASTVTHPTFEIHESDSGVPMKGHYFRLFDSEGVQKAESAVYDDKKLCILGAIYDLGERIEAGQIE